MARIPDLETHLTPALREKRAAMLAQRGLPTLGFYEQLMVYPELFEHLQALGTFVRFQSVLPPRMREIAVLMAAVEQRSAFEWQTHEKTAALAGVEPTLMAAIGSEAALDPDLTDVRDAVRCVVRLESLPQALFERLLGLYGVQGAVELITLASMYRMFAGLGAAFDSHMPADTPPPPWESQLTP